MFVFGEVQDPTSETVNLVEDIIRSQLIELVRAVDSRARLHYNIITHSPRHRSYRLVPLQQDVGRAGSRRKT